MQRFTEQVLQWSQGLHLVPKRAVRDFYGLARSGVDEEDVPSFVSYLLWGWRPRAKAVPIGEQYRRAYGSRLADWEREYLDQALHQPWRFLELIAVTPGWGFEVRDVLTGAAEPVREIRASQQLQAGDIVFGQWVRVEGITSMEALGSTPLPPESKLNLMRMRQQLQKEAGGGELTDAKLQQVSPLLRYYYFDQVERQHQPPQLQNTDGDVFEEHALRYRIGSPEAALAALAPLAVGWTQKQLLQEGEFDARGELRAITFSWAKRGNRMHKSWDNTILGTISIRGKKLTAEVNSARRAARLRREIERRLGEGAVFAGDTVTSADAMWRKAAAGRGRPQPPRDPELLAAEEEMRLRHMAEWVDTELPALDGQTPRAAVQTPDGREMVEALLLGIGRRQPAPAMWARKELGIATD